MSAVSHTLCLLLVYLIPAGITHAVEPNHIVDPPALREAAAIEQEELGLWHDVYAPADQDALLLRRGPELFRIAMTSPAEVTSVASHPLLPNSEIRGSRNSTGGFWLFLDSSQSLPFAIEIISGRIVTFDVPDLVVPGDGAPRIQSFVHFDNAVILMVQGGDRATWPRDGSGPLYFWFGLDTGELVRFPTGWDLTHFSADQRVAVFQAPGEMPFQSCEWKAVETETGRNLKDAPDYREKQYTPFDWGDERRIKPLFADEGTSGHRFAGLSVPGAVYPVTITREGRHYAENSQVHDSHLVFRFRREGEISLVPAPLYAASSLSPETEAVMIDDKSVDVQLFPGGNALFISSQNESDARLRHTAYFYDPERESYWSVFAGVAGLPDLDPDVLAQPYIHDRRRMYLIPGFGSGESTAKNIVVYVHNRGDMRSAVTFDRKPVTIPFDHWSRSIIVTADGARLMTPLFAEHESISKTWFHNSGVVFQGIDEWSGEDGHRLREIRLRMTRLEL